MDATKDKDKIVAAVSAGISDLLGMWLVASCQSAEHVNATQSTNLTHFQSPSHSLSLAHPSFILGSPVQLNPDVRHLFLLVLKSTGSAFENFIRDEHTTLPEVNDRIFSTAVDLKYTFAPFAVPANTSLDSFKVADEFSAGGTAWEGNAVVALARTATLEVFAEDESASVQVRRPFRFP